MTELKIPVLCYSRVSGYYAPLNQWNKGKTEEFKERKFIDTKALQMLVKVVDETI